MVTTRGNLDQRSRRNPEDSSDIIDIQEETQAGAENLRQSTIDSSIYSAEAKSDLTVQQTGLEYERDIHTLVGFLSVLDKLLEEIKDTKKGISKKGLSKAGKRTMDEAKTKLKQYEDAIKGKKKILLKQKKPEIYDYDIEKLRNRWEEINKVRKDIGMGQWGEYSSTASYLYNSPEIAKKSNKQQTDSIKFNQKLQKELENGAILSIFGGDVQRANSYYTRIAQKKYDNVDYQLYLDNESVLTPSFQRCGITIPSETRYQIRETRYYTGDGRYYTGNGKNPERVSGTPRRSTDYSNMDWGDTFQKGGVAGLLDKVLSNCSNMTSGQKETWKTIGVLGCFAGGIFGLYKFFTNKKMGFWAKAGITAGTIFGSQALTGEGPISLFNKLITGGFSSNELKNKFGNAIGGLGSSGSEVAETTVPTMQSMMVFNSGATAGEVQEMSQTFRRSNSNRRNFYNQSCDKIRNEYGEPAMQGFQTTFSDDFDEEKRKNWLASFGITESTDSKKTVYELSTNAYMNNVAFEKFLADNKVKVTTNPDKKAELDNYIKSKNEKGESIDINELKAHNNDWFMKESDGKTPDTTPVKDQDSKQKEENPKPENNNPNPETHEENPEEQIEKEVEEALGNGLENIYAHFEPKIKRINKVPIMKDIKKTDITKRFPELKKTIKSEFITIKNNEATINIDESKISNIFNDFLKKLGGPSSTVPNYVKKAISGKSRSSIKAELKEYKNKNNKTKYNNMRENFTIIFNNIFVPVDSTLRSQNISPKIICNGQSFNNINDAINSMDILN